MKYINLFGFMIILFTAIACEQPLNNTANSIFAHTDHTSVKYKQELARQITNSKPGELKYTFSKYLQVDDKDYLDVSIRGNGIEAKGMVLVTNWNKFEDIKRTKGLGYSGAELQNLKLDIIDQSSAPLFVYRDIDGIVD